MVGPTGWGEQHESDASRHDNERRMYDAIAEENPQFVTAREPKPRNERRSAILKDEMGKDGIEGGMSLMHLQQAVFGVWLRWLPQIIGSCVASGGIRVTVLRQLAEVFILNDTEEILGSQLVGTNNISPFGPFSYRAGRKIAGINRGDGSYCSAHIKGMQQHGILPCSTPGIVSDAFPEPQSASLYRKYGNSNDILTQFAEAAAQRKLLESVKITDESIARSQLIDGLKPFMVCSSWAFEPDYKHPSWKLRDGSPVYIYRRNRRTSWAHNMSIVGIVEVAGDWFVIVDNSWGPKAHKNGSYFVIPISLYADWIKSSEQMSIGELDLPDLILAA